MAIGAHSMRADRPHQTDQHHQSGHPMSFLINAIPFLLDRPTRRRLVERIARRLGASRKQAGRIAFYF